MIYFNFSMAILEESVNAEYIEKKGMERVIHGCVREGKTAENQNIK